MDEFDAKVASEANLTDRNRKLAAVANKYKASNEQLTKQVEELTEKLNAGEKEKVGNALIAQNMHTHSHTHTPHL